MCGLLVECGHGDACPLEVRGDGDRAALVEHLGRYLGFRAAARPPAPEGGASLAALAAMARHNGVRALGDGDGDGDGAALDRLGLALVARQGAVAPVAIGGRLHRWEWLVTPSGRLLKTDAVDHWQPTRSWAAHDLGVATLGARADAADEQPGLAAMAASYAARLARRLASGSAREGDRAS